MKYLIAVLTSFLFCLFINFGCQAQILNDSTVNIYSPKTTKVLKEDHVFRGNYEYSRVDTTLNNLQQVRNWYHDTTFYQDLGNLASPAKRLFFTQPAQIGARYGRSIFDRYNYNPANITYFDTKSPFTQFNYLQGANGQQMFNGTFSRNINPNANAGFIYERISSEKFYGGTNVRGDRQVERTGISLFTHIQTKENRYHLFANIGYAEHAYLESGGIRPDPSDNGSLDSLYDTDEVVVNLISASNREYRKTAHLSQVYRVAKEHLKVYHTFDYRSQFNRYRDDALTFTTNTATDRRFVNYYPKFTYDSVRTNEAAEFRSIENSLGIMSDSKLHFFRGYVKHRNSSYNNNLVYTYLVDTTKIEFDKKIGQYFLGGLGEFKLRDVFNVTVNGEYQLFKDYRLDAAIRLKFLTVAQSRMSYSPTFTEQLLLSNHFQWNNTNEFQNTVSDRTSVRVDGHLFNNTVNLELARTNLQNYIYFDSTAQPVQKTQQMQLYTASLHHHLRVKVFHMDHVVMLTNNSKAKEIRMPAWMVNSKLYVQGHLFKKALYGQVGVETFIQDDFKADAYMPAIQQFYLQNKISLPSYPAVDAFVNADIKSFSIFIKMVNVNQGFPKNGYFTTPLYLGRTRNLTFGLRWMFFD